MRMSYVAGDTERTTMITGSHKTHQQHSAQDSVCPSPLRGLSGLEDGGGADMNAAKKDVTATSPVHCANKTSVLPLSLS